MQRQIRLTSLIVLLPAAILSLGWYQAHRSQPAAPAVTLAGGPVDVLGACCSFQAAVTCHEMTLDECAGFGGTWLGPGTLCQGHEPCCLPDGSCLFVDRICCLDVGGIPQGPDTDCAFVKCVPVQFGGCCLDIDDGPLIYDTCQITSPALCEAAGGLFKGLGTTCEIAPCCLGGGFCQVADPDCCAASGGLSFDAGLSCSAVICPPGPIGACCVDIDDGPLEYDTCFVTSQQDCADNGGAFQGAGAVCTTQACCLPNGFCQDADPDCCNASGGVALGVNTSCSIGTGCPPLGACCLDIDDGPLAFDTCIITTPADCPIQGGFFQGVGSTCTTRACCLPGGGCQDADPECCQASGGLPLGPNSNCFTGQLCPPLGACCLDIDDGPLPLDTCIITSAAGCEQSGGFFQGAGSACTLEACCLPGGYCQDTDPDCCEASGGLPLGPDSSCTNTACPDPLGACCVDGDLDGIAETCLILSLPLCKTISGTFQGPGSVCMGTGACCFGIIGGGCIEMDGMCCDEVVGEFRGVGTVCLGDGNLNGRDDACECIGDLVPPIGIVDADDLLFVVNNWGPCPMIGPCPADIALPLGVVDADDLLAVVNNWGPCE